MYHKTIKLNIEINSIKFLDTNLNNRVGIYFTKIYRKETKIMADWSPQIPKRYKRNNIKVDPPCAKKISTIFEEKTEFIRNKLIKASFPLSFIKYVIKDFVTQQEAVQQHNKEELIITSNWFEVEPSFLLLKLPYWEKNEAFIRKFHRFNNKEFRLAIKSNKRNFSFSFFVKDKNLHPTCKIYSSK